MSISRLGAAAFLSLLAAAPLAGQGTKVGYINAATVWSEYAPAQEAEGQMNATMAGYQAEIDKLQTDFQQQLAEYQQQQSTMTPEAIQRREQQLADLDAAWRQRADELQRQATERRDELFAPINAAITAVLEEIRVEGNYGLILDVTSTAILVADPALDLTQEVVARLQAGSGSEEGT
jgi:outer membrane protein